VNHRARVTGGAVLVVTAAFAHAQPYPSKPIRFIVPFAAGGSADIVARILAPKLGEQLGQTIVVDNRPGASAIIGVEAGAKAPPDGYTVTLGGFSSHVINAYLFPKLPYDPVRDFVAITVLTRIPNILSAHPSVPVKSVKELIAFARAHPGQITYASSGSGSSQHLSGVLLQKLSGISITHVPYRSGAPAVTDLLGGHVATMFATAPSVAPHIRTGRLRALGVTSATRSPALLDVPAIGETVKGYDIATYYSAHVPAGTPKEIVTRLYTAFAKALLTPEIKDRLAADGAEAVANTPDEFAAQLKAELVRWGPLIRESGARAE
jgi:tripartite-type tricarboxylate transporter receptor subunit TctC